MPRAPTRREAEIRCGGVSRGGRGSDREAADPDDGAIDLGEGAAAPGDGVVDPAGGCSFSNRRQPSDLGLGEGPK